MADRPTLLTVKQFSRVHPAFSEASLRWLRFNCSSNGFELAFVKVGRRVLIDEEKFFDCIARQNSQSETAA